MKEEECPEYPEFAELRRPWRDKPKTDLDKPKTDLDKPVGIKKPKIGGSRPYRERDFSVSKFDWNLSWIQRLARPALGVAECVECGSVFFHNMPGPMDEDGYVRGKYGRIKLVGNKQDSTHTCERCKGRLACGYSCDGTVDPEPVDLRVNPWQTPAEGWGAGAKT